MSQEKIASKTTNLNEVSLNADKALVQLGVWGSYQLTIFCLANVASMVFAFQTMAMAFAGLTPPFICIDSTAKATSQLSHTRDQWNNNCTIQRDGQLIKCGQNSTYYKFEQSFGKTIVSEWNLVCDKKMYPQLATSMFFFGILFGSVVIPTSSDRFGRKGVFLVCVLGSSSAGTVAGLAPNFLIFTIIRFISGACVAGVTLSAWVLSCETMVPSKRSLIVICAGLWWTIGYCGTGIIAYFVPDWRTCFLVISIPCFLLLSYYWLLPESLHWYVAKGKTTEAWKWIEKAAKWNGVKVRLEDCVEDKKEEEESSDIHVHVQESLLELCRCPPLLIQTIIMAYLWIANTFVYYGLSLFATELAGDRFINYMLSGLVEIPAYLFLNTPLNRFGRRKTLAGFHVIAALALFLLTVVPTTYKGHSLIAVTTTLWLIGKYSIASSFTGVWLYGAEIMPTTVRTAGMGVCNIAARIGAILAPFSKSMLSISPYLMPALFGFSSLLAALLTLILPETAGVKLADEISEVDYGPVLSLCFNKRKSPEQEQRELLSKPIPC